MNDLREVLDWLLDACVALRLFVDFLALAMLSIRVDFFIT